MPSARSECHNRDKLILCCDIDRLLECRVCRLSTSIEFEVLDELCRVLRDQLCALNPKLIKLPAILSPLTHLVPLSDNPNLSFDEIVCSIIKPDGRVEYMTPCNKDFPIKE